MGLPSAMANKRLAIFGAGYVGSTVARQALKKGFVVTALTRNAQKAHDLRECGAEVVIGDLGSTEWHSQIEGEFDFVLNCVSSGGGGIAGYTHSYLEGMESILKWLSPEFTGTFVYTSSTSVYPQSGGVSIAETDSTAETVGTSRILLSAEDALRNARGFPGWRWFILRLSGIYGPGRHHLLDEIVKETPQLSGTGDHHLNLIHRDDICRAIWSAFEANLEVRNEIFNLSDDAPVTKSELVGWLAKRVGKPVPRFGGPGTRKRGAVGGDIPDRIISNGKAKAVLGWAPVFSDFRAGYESILGNNELAPDPLGGVKS